ncbi:MAG: hypothetical protein WCP85_02410 [Mariniphaga sp.]
MRLAYIFIINLFLVTIIGVNGSMAGTRVIKGIVYTPEGKPASGVLVTADHSKDKFYTSFDGAYMIKVDSKTTYLKFKFSDREEKVDLVGNTNNVVNFGKKTVLPVTSKIIDPK